MTRWQRPSGPLNVWKVVDGFEKLENGTKRPVKFSIQDVPDDEYRREEVFNLLHTYYLSEEPISRSLSKCYMVFFLLVNYFIHFH